VSLVADRETPLDLETWSEVQGIISRAFKLGQDPAEMLNRAGLINTPARRHQMAVIGLKRLQDAIHTWSVVEVLRRQVKNGTPGTPADMYLAVKGLVDEFVDVIQENGL